MPARPLHAPDPYLTQLIAEAERRLAPNPLEGVVLPEEDFRTWCTRLGAEGLKVDNRPFRLDNRPAMHAIYDAIPTTADEAFRYVVVLQKSTQVGFTVMEMLAAIYVGLKFGGAVGMFMPDQQSAERKSRERFLPLVRSIPSVHDLMRDPVTGRLDEGNRLDRRIGGSRFVYSWTSGRTTTESTPMDGLFLDEVQEMPLAAIEKVYERLSASDLRFMVLGSTANWPDADINHWYRRGSQYRFHTRCPTCGRMDPLDEYFPDCIQQADQGAWYVCRDGHRIDDPQVGEWRADHPELEPAYDPAIPPQRRPLRVRSFHFPQTISHTISPLELLEKFNAATDLKSFYNRNLGKPFLDPSQTPVTLAHLQRCVEAGLAAGVSWTPRATDTFMGIDQMGEFNVVWIKKHLDDGRQQLVHVEEIHDTDPFARCGQLMRLYDVRCCVVEINPNYNEAKRFAREFEGRVFLCDSFGTIADGMIRWNDRGRLSASDNRTAEDAMDRYTVRIDQFKCMQGAMSRFVRAECLMFDPQSLIQTVVDKGRRVTAAVLPRAFEHFTKTALVTEKDEEKGTNQYKRVVRKIGVDPHHSYANMLCDVAMARVHGEVIIIWPDATDEVRPTPNSAGLPAPVLEMIAQVRQPQSGCAGCAHYALDEQGQPVRPVGLCALRNFTTKATAPVCDRFEDPRS